MTSRTCSRTWTRPGNAGLAGLLALLCASAAPGQELPPGVVATVGSATITRARLDEELGRGLVRAPGAALGHLVRLEMLRQGLTAAGWDPDKVSDADIEQAKARIVARGLPQEQLAKVSRLEVAIGHCLEAWVETQLDQAALQRAWEEHRLQLVGKMRAQVVVVRQRRDAPPGEALGRARALLGELGGKDPGQEGFAQLARQRSDDPAAAVTGGDVDWFGPDGLTALGERLPGSLARACFARSEPGLIPEPIVAGDEVLLARVSAIHLPPDARFQDHADEARMLATVEAQRRALREWRARYPVRYAPDAPKPDEPLVGRDE